MKIIGKSSVEIFDCIRAMIQAGDLKHGQALPTVRELAEFLGVNRNTVSKAYKRLVDAGIATAQGRQGTYVRHQPIIGEQEGVDPNSVLKDLASGNPNPKWLPDITAVLSTLKYRPRLYGEPTLNTAVEDIGKNWMYGDCPDNPHLNLTNGAVDAVERLLSAHLQVGDKVLVEDPCFVSSINTLRLTGLQALGVRVDAQGMLPEELQKGLDQGAQAVIITPRAHNPTGCSLSEQRASEIRSVLTSYPHVLIIVDDHFSELSAESYFNVIPEVATRWALVRSVSKMLGPDLRLAFIASDDGTSKKLRLRLAPGTNWVSHLLQDAVTMCLRSSNVRSLISDAKADYTRRRLLLEEELENIGISLANQSDGLNLWLPLKSNSRPIVMALAQRGWEVRGGEPFGVNSPSHGLRITISTIKECDIAAFASDLHDVLKNQATYAQFEE